MVVNNEEHKTLIKAKMEVSVDKKKQFKLNNLKITTDLGVLIGAKFKAYVRKMLNLSLEIPIPIIIR